MNNSNINTHRQTKITAHRVTVIVLLVALVSISSVTLALQFRPAPSVAEIANAINGPTKFQRPSTMEYVPKTNSCVVGGTVTSTEWHVGLKSFAVGDVVDTKTVDYTVFGFKSDQGRKFSVSVSGALFTQPGENLGLNLYCNNYTMNSVNSFGMLAIIWGGQ